MKWIVGVICIIVCTFIGYLLTDKYLKRKVFFSDFLSFNKKFIGELNYSKSTLTQIINDFEIKSGDFYTAITPIISSENINLSYSYLKQDEKEFVNKYFKSIISQDEKTLSNHLNFSMEKINEYYKSSIDDEKKYRSLYIKLGFLIGIIIFILII